MASAKFFALLTSVLGCTAFVGCVDEFNTNDADADTSVDTVLDTIEDTGVDTVLDTIEDTVADTGMDTIADIVEEDMVTRDHAVLWIAVDDTAEQTYADGNLEWRASLTYDPETNRVVYDEGWTGPFPLLYDDGPFSEGGHEAEGQTSGDHVFTTQVEFVADGTEATEFTYGIADEYGWIWPGTSGTFIVPAGSTDTIQVEGMVLPAFGDIDMLILLDITSLVEDVSTPVSTVEVKSTLNGWQLMEMVDDGTLGDETMDDGIYSFMWSAHDGGHYGLLHMDDRVTFMVVLDGNEYRVDGVGVHDGITVYTDYVTEGVWTEEVIVNIPSPSGTDPSIIVGAGS